jgi:SH3-like domain-containing protein
MESGMTTRLGLRLLAALAAGLVLSGPARADLRPMARPAALVIPPVEAQIIPASNAPAPTAPAARTVGSETNLPLPRFVSLKTDEGNARRGPGLSYRIDWVFVREDMPLRITAESGHWRRIEDRDGQGGWIHYQLLSGVRTVIVDRDRLPLRSRPDEGAQEVVLLQRNVIARLESCEPDWCRVSAGGYGGWAPKAALWGVGAEEVLD